MAFWSVYAIYRLKSNLKTFWGWYRQYQMKLTDGASFTITRYYSLPAVTYWRSTMPATLAISIGLFTTSSSSGRGLNIPSNPYAVRILWNSAWSTSRKLPLLISLRSSYTTHCCLSCSYPILILANKSKNLPARATPTLYR